MTHPRAAQWHSRQSNMRPMTLGILAEAKQLMRAGICMSEAAKALGVLSSDLDASLWGHIGESPDTIGKPIRRLHEADF